MDLYISIFRTLPERLKRQHIFLYVVGVLASIAEVISVGSIIPVSTAILNPSVLSELPLVGAWAGNQNILTLSSLFIGLIVAALVVRLSWIVVSTKVTFGTGRYFAEANFNALLNLNYADYSDTKINEYSSLITSKANMLSKGVINAYAVIINSTILVAAYLTTVVITGSPEGLVVCLTIGLVYLLISAVVRKKLSNVSSDISTLSVRNMELVYQGFLAFKDIVMNNMQDSFKAEFARSETRLTRARQTSQVVGEVPRALIETIFIFGIVVFLYFWSLEYGGADDIFKQIPELMFLLVAVQRVLPLLQRIYSSWASIRSNRDITVDVLRNISGATETVTAPIKEVDMQATRENETGVPSLSAADIKLDRVSFGYSEDLVLKGFSAKFTFGKFTAIVGPSGCGKSTLLDLLLGLLQPTEGQIIVRGQSLSGNQCLDAWRTRIAHVAQSPYFFEGTIRQNILFGSSEELDESLARNVINVTGLSSLADSLDEVLAINVGAYGLRLSGGQRQRLAVARALYKQSDWLIMDEPTSALDEISELALVRAIRSTFPSLSILCVSHSGQLAQEADVVCDLSKK